ncbi:DUF6037 family protein [Clostridium felsineum]|uniref:DUF6037 family protein n=1 Tax=Clostridium felsineum TaxID=36839 RepID=UPI00098BE90B|nr:DUF6037 family protein [Clostridium felsineum]URZ02162.1 hypothetical protein CLAUR_021590 [Clostridium felsineum]
MEYLYSGLVEGLKDFYWSMRNINVRIGTFEHKYNTLSSDVIFDTRSLDGWKLIFIKRIEGSVLEIQIKRGYRFTIEGNEEYNLFRKYFGISGNKGEFSIKDFVSNLNRQVPFEYRITDEKRKTIIQYDKIDNKSKGIYPIGVTNWEVVHAKNSKLSKDIYHRTSENLEKTQELYPKIYECTKNLDITIIYGMKPNEKTKKIKMGRW